MITLSFFASLYESTGSYCHRGVSVGVGISGTLLSFMMGKALSGELFYTQTGLVFFLSFSITDIGALYI